MHEFSKSQKRRLRELTGRLYELDVKESLAPLFQKFEEWNAGRLSSLELSGILHEYDYGESRRLWARYQSKRQDSLVASGFVRGLVSEADIGNDILKELQGLIQMYREEEE